MSNINSENPRVLRKNCFHWTKSVDVHWLDFQLKKQQKMRRKKRRGGGNAEHFQGRILLGLQNFLNSEKGRLQSLRQPGTKRMRILKTAEPEMKAIFIG